MKNVNFSYVSVTCTQLDTLEYPELFTLGEDCAMKWSE